MSSLVWGIKASLVAYIRGMGDGRIELDGVTEDGGAFTFSEGDGPLAFRGAVTLIAHGGMMHVALGDPALEQRDAGWVLTIADPDDASVRLAFATAADLVREAHGRRATGTALTADGADLFFGPYEAGTPLDDPFVAD